MLIVVCLDLEDGIDPIQGLIDGAAIDGADVTLLHVVDTVERAKLEDSVLPGIVRPSLRDFEVALDVDERAMLRETYERAASLLRGLHAGDVRLNVGHRTASAGDRVVSERGKRGPMRRRAAARLETQRRHRSALTRARCAIRRRPQAVPCAAAALSDIESTVA
jgi:hypothetical protein